MFRIQVLKPLPKEVRLSNRSLVKFQKNLLLFSTVLFSIILLRKNHEAVNLQDAFFRSFSGALSALPTEPLVGTDTGATKHCASYLI